MLEITPRLRIPLAEFEWAYSRSGGPGGQNVNKVASKAQLRWNLAETPSLPPEIKSRLMALFPSRITIEGEFLIDSSRYRDQERNREDCLMKLAAMLRQAASPPKLRRPTKPSKASNRRRLADKKHNSSRKESRQVNSD